MVTPPKCFTLHIDNLAHGGDGVGKLPDGRACFVPKSIPGESVEISLVQSKKHWARGRIQRILSPSKHRIAPECQSFRTCGGCQFWHVDYQTEFEIKAKAVLETIERISKIPLPNVTHIPATHEKHYRNRATFHIRQGNLGFFKERSQDIIDTSHCLVLDPRVSLASEIIKASLNDFLASSKYTIKNSEVFVETSSTSASIATIKAKSNTDYDILLQWASSLHFPLFPHSSLQSAATELDLSTKLSLDGLRIQREIGVFQDFGHTHVLLSESIAFDPGEKYQVPAERFRQNNAMMNHRLVDLVVSWARSFEPDHVVELFCGMGNLTFALSKLNCTIDAYDIDQSALDIGEQITQTYFSDRPLGGKISWHCANLFSDCSVRGLSQAQLLVLDPPRAGAKEVIEALSDSTTLPIIYVACDAACMARDAAMLQTKNYAMTRLALVDMFPRTAHIECVALFEHHTLD